jgi:hypothetical protein
MLYNFIVLFMMNQILYFQTVKAGGESVFESLAPGVESLASGVVSSENFDVVLLPAIFEFANPSVNGENYLGKVCNKFQYQKLI